MNAIFIELPAFERHRSNYLDDDSFRLLQDTLMANAGAGDPIEGTAVRPDAQATSSLEGTRERRIEDEKGI